MLNASRRCGDLNLHFAGEFEVNIKMNYQSSKPLIFFFPSSTAQTGISSVLSFKKNVIGDSILRKDIKNIKNPDKVPFII